MIDKPFVYMETAQGMIMINLLQIVRVDNLTGKACTLHMSDGTRITFEDGAAGQMIERLAHLAITGTGEGMADYFNARSGPLSPAAKEGEESER